MQIQFLTFDGCPLADAAQRVLEQALVQCGLRADAYETVDVLDPATSTALRGWGSPTILVNGIDVTGQPPAGGVSCRIYDGPDGSPHLKQVVATIQGARAES